MSGLSDVMQRIDWPPLLLSLKAEDMATALASIAGMTSRPRAPACVRVRGTNGAYANDCTRA